MFTLKSLASVYHAQPQRLKEISVHELSIFGRYSIFNVSIQC
jgi:hypothetical protein